MLKMDMFHEAAILDVEVEGETKVLLREKSSRDLLDAASKPYDAKLPDTYNAGKLVFGQSSKPNATWWGGGRGPAGEENGQARILLKGANNARDTIYISTDPKHRLYVEVEHGDVAKKSSEMRYVLKASLREDPTRMVIATIAPQVVRSVKVLVIRQEQLTASAPTICAACLHDGMTTFISSSSSSSSSNFHI